MPRRAFSLIELLVVVAIIALLLGILVPTIASSRHQGRVTVGHANLRSVSQIMLQYANEQQDQFLNPFRAKWPESTPGGMPGWAIAVSVKDPTIRWDFYIHNSCDTNLEAHTEGFSSVWYSYLAEYRGAPRVSPEQFSPADPTMMEYYQRIRGDSDAMDEVQLSSSSFMYSPTFWSNPDRYAGAIRLPMTPERILTATYATVRHPAAKVMVYERQDFSTRKPRALTDGTARPMVATVDGSTDRADMGDIMRRIDDGTDRELMPVVASGCQIPGATPLFFFGTSNGVRGRDLPRN